MDYQSLLYDPIYDVIGVEARLVAAPGHPPVTVTVIDKTAGLPLVGDGGMEIETVRPAAMVRVAELIARGLCREAIDGGTVAFSCKCWKIESSRPAPSPKGERDGELMLILSEAA
jgi:hypothetical protein